MKRTSLFLAFVFVSVAARASSIDFTDTNFKLSDWSETSFFKSNPKDKMFEKQCPNCGHTGQAMRIQMRLPKAGDTVAVGFVNNTFSYDPQTHGAIGSIDASVDKKIVTNLPVNPNTTFTNTFRPMIEQDGIFYLATISGPTFNGGNTHGNTISEDGLMAADFTQFNFSTGTFGTAHPDFAGDQMFFGLSQLTTFGLNKVGFRAIYDNLHFSINPVPDAGGTLLLLVGAVGMLAGLRRPFARSQPER